jgi:HSP20 family molecular chaperone IbpA
MPFTQFKRNEWSDSVRLLNQLAHRFDRLMPPILSDMLQPSESDSLLALPDVDKTLVGRSNYFTMVDENDTHVHYQVEMPGVTKDNLKLEYYGKTIKWSAHRQTKTVSADGNETMVSTSDYSGSYTLPFKPADVKGKLENGLLDIVVTKPSLPDESSVVVNVD